jgi:hypothetical protein
MSPRIRRIAVTLPLAGALLGVAWTAAPSALADTWTGQSRPPAVAVASSQVTPSGVTWGGPVLPAPDDTWT